MMEVFTEGVCNVEFGMKGIDEGLRRGLSIGGILPMLFWFNGRDLQVQSPG